MTEFLKLTRIDTGERMFVNRDHIEWFGPMNHEGTAVTQVVVAGKPILVKEAVDNIAAKLREK